MNQRSHASVETEKKLISVLVKNPVLIKMTSNVVQKEYFYLDEYKQLYSRILELDSRGISPTRDTLKKDSTKDNLSDEVIENICNEQDSKEEDIYTYINHIKECYEYRLFHSLPAKIIDIRDDDDVEYDEKKNKITRLIDDFNKLNTIERDYSKKSTILSTIEKIENINKGIGIGIDTGIEELDKHLLGIEKGELVIIAARPSVGKSLVAGQIMLNMIKEGHGVVLFNYEMSREEIMLRMLSNETGIPHTNIVTGKLTDSDMVLLTEKMEYFMSLPFMIVDDPKVTINDIKVICNKAGFKPDCIISDYLQIMPLPKGKKNDTMNNLIGEISKELKTMASKRELDVVMISLSQLSREIEKRSNNKPMLSDLKDSGNIEQDADRVLFLSRPENDDMSMFIHVAKQRNRSLPKMPVSVNLDKNILKIY